MLFSFFDNVYNRVLVKIFILFYSYERFYNASIDPLAFYQIVFSKQDVVSCTQKVTIDNYGTVGGASNIHRQ